MTLYAMNYRQAASRSGVALKYCVGPCTQIWAPLTAPADTKPVGLWKVVDGAQGPQWSSKGNPVFTYANDTAPGSTAGDGYDDLWTAIAYIPPLPKLIAPANVTAVLADGDYIMADSQGHPLYTSKTSDTCNTPCTWLPLAAGMASQGLGQWSVFRDGDRPQWAYRGKLVYVSQEEDPTRVPPAGIVLRP
jgi:predicted lipoprotein with Yx(FWY)xxD motif